MRYLILLLVLISGFVNADPLRFLGIPVYYSKYVPKIAHCVYTETARYGYCGWTQYPEEGTVGVITKDGTQRKGFHVRLYDEITCIKGKCVSNYGEDRGDIPDINTTYWYIPKGFYLTELSGSVTAVKYGNGPGQKKYPIRDIKLMSELDEQPDGYFIPEANDNTYSVYCNEAKECTYMGRVFKYEELKEYIPNVLTTDCDSLFCYSPGKRVVGINPKVI